MKVSRLKYASAATRGGTEPAWLAYRAYAKFLAEQIDAKGLKGRVELWNEPPWSADPWDHRNGFYDNPPIGTITNSPNFGMLHAVIDQPVSLPANVRYSWGGSHKSASGGVLFSSLPKPTAAQVVAVVPSEGFHPYGSTPEWHLWYPDALAAATDSTVFSTHLEGTNWQSNFKNGRRIAYQNKTNLGWTVNEQISEIGLFTSDQTAKARYSVRAFLAYMAAGPQPQMDRVNFYRLAEEPDKLAMIDINTREELPAYVAMKGLMNDIAAIGVAPGAYTTASLPAAVSPYSGYFPLMTIPVVGRSASIETKNSVLFVSYQRTYAETTALWQALAPPTVPVNISIPTGYVAQAAWDLVTRQAVPFTVAGSTVTYSVADNPVALKVTPTGGSQNVAPSAVNDSATTNESTAATIDVLANDSDADNGPQPLILASVTPPAHGTTAIVNGKILYTPNGGYFGEDSFTYTASDAALPATATVNVTVNSTATANNLTGFGLAGAAVGTGAGSSRVLADQAWEINGAGAGATGSADALWFESYATTGNFLARVRLQSLTGGAGARAGLMLREGTGAGGRFVQVGAGADATTRFTSRQPAGAAATAEQSAPAQNQYAFPDKWLLIERIGDVVTVRVDDNNSGYTEIARITLGGLSASLQLGLFTASGDAGPSARAVFSDFEFSELTTWTGLAGTQSWSNANNWSFTPPATALAPNSGDSTRVFNVAIPSGTVAADGSGYTSGDPENTGRRIGSITIGAEATVLRHTNAAVAYRDFFTGRNQSSVPSTSGVVDNRGTLRNQTAGSDWLFKWSPVTHVNAGTIEARNANAKVKFTISSATIDNTGGSITATAGGIVDFENTSSLVVQGGSLSTDAASPTKSQLQSIPTSLGSGTLASLNFLDAQIANAGTFLHDAATSQAGTRNHLTQFSGTSVFNNTGTFKVRQAMTSTDPGTQFQTSVVEFRGTAQLVNQASGSVVVTNESTSTSPGTTGLQRAVRLDFPESSTAFNNLGTVTITDTAATAGLNANAELRSTAPLTNQGQINITGLRSFLTMTGAEPYRQTAGSTVLSGATIAAANSSIEGGALKGWGTVSGNLALSGSSVFEAQLQSNGTSNLIQVIGTAEIGGTLQVTLPGGYDPAAGTEFRIMTASAGFEGAFAAVPISWQVVVRGTDLILVRENFSLWTGAYFTASELNQPSISGALANPDFDALCNLLEYALGSNPRAHDAPSHLPVADTQTGFLRMTVTRPRPAPRDLIYQPQVIGDLANGSWQGIPFDGPAVDNGNGTETLTARDTVPVTAGQPRFIRLQVQVAP
ncbi:MAG: Ig-like domain-containing protein [Chthoniobacteraceae bacterium]